MSTPPPVLAVLSYPRLSHPVLLHTSLQAGDSPLQLGPKSEESGKVNGNPLSFLLRLLLGTAAGFYYFLVSLGMGPVSRDWLLPQWWCARSEHTYLSTKYLFSINFVKHMFAAR